MYRKLLILALAAFVCTPQVAQAHTTKSAENKKDTITVLSEVAVVAKMKQKNNLREESLSSTTIKLGEIERNQVVSLQDAAMQVPNLHIPS
jgi:hypothetical protein